MKKRTLQEFLVVLSLFALFAPQYLEQLPVVAVVFDISKAVVGASILILTIRKRKWSDRLSLCVISFYLLNMIITLVRGGSVGTCLNEAMYVCLIVLLLNIVNDDMSVFFSAASLLFGAYMHINLLSYFLFPQGLYTNIRDGACYFLGLPNTIGVLSVFVAAIALLHIFQWKKWRIWNISVLLSTVLSVLMMQVATAILAFVVFLAAYIFFFLLKEHHGRKFGLLSVVYSLGIFVCLQFFSIQNSFLGLVNLLGDDATLHGRTEIWSRAWIGIKEAVLFGHGFQTREFFISYFDLSLWFSSTHSTYLQILFCGGVAGFAFFIAILIFATARFDKVQDTCRSELYIFPACLCGILTGLQTEYYHLGTLVLWLCVSVLYRAEKDRELPKPKRALVLRLA